MYTLAMKHAHLLLDESLLSEARRISAAGTFSGAVTEALQSFVRQAQARRILELRGTGAWEGDLGEMRGDRPRHRSTRKPARAAR